jgi:hypothetical protein
MAYTYFVFVSYLRERRWNQWSLDFQELLEGYLRDYFKDARVFVDQSDIDEGSDWPHKLAEALACSRIIVPLLSPAYFDSQWCVHELDLMMERAKKTGPDRNLIVPVIVQSGAAGSFPDEVNRIQATIFEHLRIITNDENPMYGELSIAIKKLTPKIVKAIESAPRFDSAWLVEARKRCDEIHDSNRSGREVLVRNFTPKRSAGVFKVPQLI